MKIAYISPAFLSDVDLSYLPEAQKYNQIDYYLCVNDKMKKSAAISIDELKQKSKVYPSNAYCELNKLSGLIKPNSFFVVNDLGKRSYSWLTFKAYLHLLFLIIKGKYDLIHITWHPYIHYFWIYLFRRKVVMTVHDPFPHSCIKSKINTLYRSIAFRLFRNFIVLNKSQKNEFIDYYKLSPNQVHDSVLSVYSYRNIYIRKAHNNKLKSDYTLFFGQITSHKGLDILLPAIREVHDKNHNIRLVIAGKGEFHFDISEYINLPYIDIINRFIEDEELTELICNAKFIIAPYLDATQSGVVMSAFAFNKPCIVTNVGGLPEMVVDGKYGIVIPSSNKDELVNAILYLSENIDDLNRMSNNIKNDYKDGHLSWDYIANNISSLYHQFK